MYLSIMTFGFCFSYFILLGIFSLFFQKKAQPTKKKVVLSLFLIVSFSLIVNNLFSSDLVFNIEMDNRILHALGGGFLSFLVCFLVVKNNNFSLNRLQFFILSALIVVAFGVANEIAEFILQYYFGQIMSTNINDTWLDLISNTFGLLGAAIIFTPFVDQDGRD